MNKTLNYYNEIAKDFIADTVNIEFNEMHQKLLLHKIVSHWVVPDPIENVACNIFMLEFKGDR